MEQPRQESRLLIEENFEERVDALELLSFPAGVREALEAVDERLFQRLQSEIRTGRHRGKGFRDLAYRYVGPVCDETGYDNLDIFINRLFPYSDIPEPTLELEPEMVYYQKTPARIVFELAERLSAADVFYDLGSGLGQVAILVHLLTGIPSTGIEFEPAFCAYARDCADWLRLPGVTFLHTDARRADYSEGTAFFLFTPFKGEILQAVLGLLQKEASRRKISVFTYGPCTAAVASAPWLEGQAGDPYTLCVFRSI